MTHPNRKKTVVFVGSTPIGQIMQNFLEPKQLNKLRNKIKSHAPILAIC